MKVKKEKYRLRLLEKSWYVAFLKRRYFYVFNRVNHLRKKSGKCYIVFIYWEFNQLVQMLRCLWCCKFWKNCMLMIFIIGNDLWILVSSVTKIIRYNVFNSSFPSFSSPVNQVGVYFTRGCLLRMSSEDAYCDVIIINWLRRVTNSSSIWLSLQVLLDFLKPHFWKQWTHQHICQHIFPSHL